jgi:hypothetical protein
MQRQHHPPSQFIISIVVAVLFLGQGLADNKNDWKDRFYTEAPKHWEDYLRFARNLQITATANIYYGADRSPKRSVRTEIKQTEGASLLAIYRNGTSLQVADQERDPASEAEVEGTNPSYLFKLKRRGPERGWIITDLKLPDKPTALDSEQGKLQEKHLQRVCNCLTLENLWLPTLIHDPDFKITAIMPQQIDGRPVVRLDFDYPKPDEDYPHQGGLPIKGGWMALDPEHDWILREYVVHTGQPEKNYVHKIFQIQEGTNHHPMLTHLTHQVFYKPSGKETFEIGENVESEWQAVERSDVPLEEFTVSGFGLPEPPGIQVAGSRLHLWIALAAIACIGIAALIRWQIRRRRIAA